MHDGKTNEWRNQAHDILADLAKNNSMVVSDMVVTALEANGLGLDNYSVLGGVFNRAAKEGLIVKTDITQQSTRAKSKSAKTIWRSLVYVPADQSKEQSVINSLLVAALDFNAETIRLASLVFAGGEMDQSAYVSHIKAFNEISDKYVSRQAKVLESIGQEY
jgi:hypothetical protein